MIIENKPIILAFDKIEECGKIELSYLANTETVNVTVLGERIIPMSFDIFGNPYFTKEQLKIFMVKADNFRRKAKKRKILEAEITYEERKFDVQKERFDSINGINESLSSLYTLNEMLESRKIYKKKYPSGKLNEYIIFGSYFLDDKGNITAFQKDELKNIFIEGDVQEYEAFIENNNRSLKKLSNFYCIPQNGTRCKCCGELFTIDDVRNKLCIKMDGEFYHEQEFFEYIGLLKASSFCNDIMNNVYKQKDCSFEVLLDTTSWEEKFPNISRILFHTIDGDIIISNISHNNNFKIEWQNNYKKFDVLNIFEDIKSVVVTADGVTSITTWGIDKAIKYLLEVRKAVRPKYNMKC